MEQRVYRVKVVEHFLRAGIPLAKVLRSLLEEGALRLTHSSHLADYIPLIQSEEKKLIRSEVDHQDVAVIFDGTARLGEALRRVVGREAHENEWYYVIRAYNFTCFEGFFVLSYIACLRYPYI